ncbi:Hypothetical predicted protein [Scomber scombrus]|uniref:Uncharacterized protein n=1 Tax=Scomber scombrus TaxID=13677 RepID=A0AAV1Q1C8_SCOSC
MKASQSRLESECEYTWKMFFNPCWNVDTEKLLPPIYLNDIEKSLYTFNSNHRPHGDGKTAENCEMLVITDS